jgi:hypothetical protein
MTPVIVDTSVWIGFFRKGDEKVSLLLDSLLEQDCVAICGIVEMELLRGVRPEERKRLGSLLDALHYIETVRKDFIRAGERLNELRQKGITIPSTDALIAMICVRNNLPLFTLDTHFDHLPEVKRFDIATFFPQSPSST